ncbi:MAG: SRPBCC family protein [Actinomycetota bacterium]
MGIVDQGFVPEAPRRVYARLADLDRYGEWWTGASVRRAGDAVELRIPRLGGTRVRLEGERPGTGVILRMAGPGLAGSLEWYLEPFKEGTIVNAILELEPGARGHARRLLRFRRALRGSLVALRHEVSPGAAT